MWDAQLLRSIILELGLTKETANEKRRTKLQRIIALRESNLKTRSLNEDRFNLILGTNTV